MFATRRFARHAGILSAATAAALAVSVGAAQADIVYNTLDATIDAAAENMNLVYDATNSIPGPNGTTTLAIQIQGHSAGDHAGCNIQGGAHYIGLAATSSNTSAATVAFQNGVDTFYGCSDVLTVVVTPTGVGTSTVTFAIDGSKTSNDPSLAFSFTQATFVVNVTDSTVGGGTVCDADPAAPAWAAALLKGNNVKAKPNTADNYVSQVAAHMGPRTSFNGYEKNAHPDYENAVWSYMKTTFGLTLANGPAAVAKPGWTCTTV